MSNGIGCIGNDVIDLGDPETRLDGLHPRFEQRVFTAAERAALATSPSRHRLHWALWAAKESAFKALKQLEPGLAWAPRAFEVVLEDLPREGRGPEPERVSGLVTHERRVLSVQIELTGSHLHAVALPAASRAPAALAPLEPRVLAAVSEAGEDPGASARQLALEAIAGALLIDPRRLRVEGRPPLVLRGDSRLEVALSLSHHGRFAAFAAFAASLPSAPPRSAG